MGEVDEALARAYAQSRTTRPRPPDGAADPVPPPPHVSTRPGTARPVASGLSWPGLVLTLEQTCGDRFERLADVLLEAREVRRLQTFLFTSPHRAEGRTTLVLTLARTLARRPGRTLVVDADLTGPMLGRQLGLRPDVGLDDVVLHGHALSEALVSAPEDNLTFLPLRVPVAHPKGFLADPGWASTLARLRREFDLVLLDGPPLFTGLSPTAPHRSIDTAVLVHSPARSGARGLARARAALESAGIPVLGLAETFVP